MKNVLYTPGCFQYSKIDPAIPLQLPEEHQVIAATAATYYGVLGSVCTPIHNVARYKYRKPQINTKYNYKYIWPEIDKLLYLLRVFLLRYANCIWPLCGTLGPQSGPQWNDCTVNLTAHPCVVQSHSTPHCHSPGWVLATSPPPPHSCPSSWSSPPPEDEGRENESTSFLQEPVQTRDSSRGWKAEERGTGSSSHTHNQDKMLQIIISYKNKNACAWKGSRERCCHGNRIPSQLVPLVWVGRLSRHCRLYRSCHLNRDSAAC